MINKLGKLYGLRLLILIAAYFAFAKFSLLLSIPPGFVTSVWLPSGIALAGVLLGGYKYLPGIFFGSLLINVTIACSGCNTSIPLEVFFTAACIGLGAAAQAGLGAFLIKRVMVFPNSLELTRDIALLLVLGGPISSIVNATIGTLTLLFTGFISTESYIFNWLTWWVGDTIGIIVFTPLVIVLASPSTITSLKRKVQVFIPSVLLIGITIVGFMYARGLSQEKIFEDFNLIADRAAENIEKEINSHALIMDSIERFFNASDNVTREEFAEFLQDVLNNDSVQAIKWVPKILLEERRAYERQLKQDGFQRYEIVEQDEGTIIKAKDRPFCFPIHYVEPFEGNEALYNFDLSSSSEHLTLLLKARDTGLLTGTPKLKLFQNISGSPEFLLIRAIYNSKEVFDTVESRRKNLLGFAVGSFKINDFISAVLGDISNSPYSLFIIDNYLRGEDAIIYGKPNQNSIYTTEFLLDVAGRQWTLMFSPQENFLQKYSNWEVWLVLIAGLFFTSLCVALLLIITARAETINRLVEEQTQEIKKTTEYLEAVMNATIDSIIIFDAQGVILSINAATQNIFDYTAEEMLGNQISKYIPDILNDKAVLVLDDASDEDSSDVIGQVITHEGIKRDGSGFPLELSVSELVEGSVTYFVCIARDITERRSHELQKEQLIDQLTDSNAELERFAYVASHDLQEPLRMVVSFTELLAKNYADQLDEKAQNYIQIASGSAKKMRQLVTDLLEYSRVGAATEAQENIDMNRVLENVLENLSESIKESRAKIISETLPTLKGNYLKLSLLLQNIIGNALKYRQVSVYPIVTISVSEENNDWVFTVKDNGIGMKTEYLESIFLPFKRLHSHEYAGTGMGLAICKKIIESLEGRIWVDSAVGQGTCFYFTLPKHDI